MRIGSRDIPIPRGWIVEYADGSILCEGDMSWKKLPNKKDIKRVILRWEDRWWSFDDKQHYLPPSRREMINIMAGVIGPSAVHSRTIGFYDMSSKEKVILRVEEATGKATYETMPF